LKAREGMMKDSDELPYVDGSAPFEIKFRCLPTDPLLAKQIHVDCEMFC
jgi:hypothetical protein